MIGAPPVAGFVTKWYLLDGAGDAGPIGIIVVLLASTLLNAAYFAPVVYHAFFGEPDGPDHRAAAGEAPWTMVVPLSLTALISVFLGLYPDFLLGLVRAILP